MTQHEKILRYMIAHPKSGITIREGVMLGINWPHKRISEIEQMGVGIKRVDVEEKDTRFRRYILMDPAQDTVEQFLKHEKEKRECATRG